MLYSNNFSYKSYPGNPNEEVRVKVTETLRNGQT